MPNSLINFFLSPVRLHRLIELYDLEIIVVLPLHANQARNLSAADNSNTILPHTNEQILESVGN